MTLPSQEEMKAWLAKNEEKWVSEGNSLKDRFYFNYDKGYTPLTYKDDLLGLMEN
jgi:hypothetical protein